MPWILRRRETRLSEWMDQPDCDPVRLERTYRNFRLINRLISRWQWVWRTHIRPVLEPGRTNTLLDIGFGGGDLPLQMMNWAHRDGYRLAITGVETDPRAVDYTRRNAPHGDSMRFLHAPAEELVHQGQQFDIVVSNHMLHHLDDDELPHMLQTARQLSRRLVLFNDIERSDAAWLLFHLTWPMFPGSYNTPDGLVSIRRSFTAGELAHLAPTTWQVERLLPWRLLLITGT